jgi:argininosuccinate lyase
MAEYLVRAGMPFREAHEVTGKVVAYCIGEKKVLDGLTLKELKRFSKLFKKDVFNFLSVEASVETRASEGGTSLKEVRKQVKRLKGLIGK